jgi:alanine dehydrogenase
MGATDGTAQHIGSPVLGLPRMHMEAGERRDFLPEFVVAADRAGAGEIVLEHGYGAGMGFGQDAYLAASPRVRFADYAEVLASDIVTVIRCPDEAALRSMHPDALLVTMLHYPTRPRRTKLVADLGLRAISLDAVVDDLGRRQVEYLEAVGWNGVRLAFVEIARMHPHFAHPSRRPLRVTCLGAGAVGAHAVRAATRYGDPELRAELAASDVPGVEVTVVDFDLTRHEDYLLGRLEVTDLLIDATHRLDATRPIVPNPWIEALPADAVILDLAVDPYDLTVDPPLTKGIEGVPHGNLDRYVFPVDDAAWDELDHGIDTRQRRLALSCYAWPGIEPVDCMRVYGRQIEPVLGVVLRTPTGRLDVDSDDPWERAVAHAELGRWLA